MKLSRLKLVTYFFFLAGVLYLPAWAAKTAQPGSLNYIEGQARIDNQPVDGVVLKRSTSRQPACASVFDRLFDGAHLPLAHHRQVRKAFLNRPLFGRRAPVELGLAQPPGQFPGLIPDRLDFFAVLFEFGGSHRPIIPGSASPSGPFRRQAALDAA